MKKLFRFSKAITVLCVVMNILITAVLAVLLFRGASPDGTVVMAMYAPFSIELGFNAMIAMAEKKNKNEDAGDAPREEL